MGKGSRSSGGMQAYSGGCLMRVFRIARFTSLPIPWPMSAEAKPRRGRGNTRRTTSPSSRSIPRATQGQRHHWGECHPLQLRAMLPNDRIAVRVGLIGDTFGLWSHAFSRQAGWPLPRETSASYALSPIFHLFPTIAAGLERPEPSHFQYTLRMSARAAQSHRPSCLT
jgi:hypothetical protein